MKLDRRITLHRPDPTSQSASGSISRGGSTTKRVYANRRAQAGFGRIAIDTLVTEYPVNYTVRAAGLQEIDATWWVVDKGIEYRIESVYEPNFGRNQYLVLVCVERK